MKLIKHLEYVIDLVDRSSPYSEIKSALLAMHQEVEGYEQTAANQVKLAEELSDLQSKNAKLEADIARRDSEDAKGAW